MQRNNIVLAAIIAFASLAAKGESSVEGAWFKKGFLQIHTACTQVWECRLKTNTIHDNEETISYTPPVSTTGVCNAGGGPIDSCNNCSASAPVEKCIAQFTTPE